MSYRYIPTSHLILDNSLLTLQLHFALPAARVPTSELWDSTYSPEPLPPPLVRREMLTPHGQQRPSGAATLALNHWLSEM